jgi:two-component system, OmpR family, phosphate regulon response regulator PhoB
VARIVFVNDQADLAELVKLTLEDAGHHVVPVIEGKRAFEVIKGERPDLVILDWVLDGLTGEDVLRQLRADPATASTPILMASALADVRAKAEVLGADGVLGKPFTEEALLEAVDTVIDSRA